MYVFFSYKNLTTWDKLKMNPSKSTVLLRDDNLKNNLNKHSTKEENKLKRESFDSDCSQLLVNSSFTLDILARSAQKVTSCVSKPTKIPS